MIKIVRTSGVLEITVIGELLGNVALPMLHQPWKPLKPGCHAAVQTRPFIPTMKAPSLFAERETAAALDEEPVLPPAVAHYPAQLVLVQAAVQMLPFVSGAKMSIKPGERKTTDTSVWPGVCSDPIFCHDAHPDSACHLIVKTFESVPTENMSSLFVSRLIAVMTAKLPCA